jgi:zinc transport system permease protein
MPEILQLEFMRTAFIVAIMVGIVAPLVGLLLVERRMSLIGDGLGHLAFAGVGAGLVLGIEPVLAALVTAVLGAVAIEWIRARRLAAGDRALALMFYTGLAGGVVLISAAGQRLAGINTYLFGSILTIDETDVWRTGIASLLVATTIVFAWRGLAAVAIDEEGSAIRGVPVRSLNIVVALLTAVTVAASIRTVGVLLIGALLVLPVMTSGLIAWSLRSTAVLGSVLGAAIAIGGLTLAYYGNWAPGGTIVLLAAAIYTVALIATALLRRA